MTNFICSAPKALEDWYSTQNLEGIFDRYELRLPKSEADGNKAAFGIELGRFLGSFAIWGTGTYSWILVDSESGDTLVSRNEEFTTITELRMALDSAVREMIKLQQSPR